MTRRRPLLVWSLAITAAAAAAHGAWIPVKAVLAQQLLARSFAAAQAGAPPAPPWPWADLSPIARLEVERLDVRRLVLDSATGAALAFGPGHLAGTPRPGRAGNVVVAGHRDTHFAFLAALRAGDRISLETTTGDRQEYEVEWTRVVDAGDTWVTASTHGDVLTLITCYPFDGVAGRADERYVVRARASLPR